MKQHLDFSLASLLVPVCFGLSALVAGAAPSSNPSPALAVAQATANLAARPQNIQRPTASLAKLAKYEPVRGVYLGASLSNAGLRSSGTTSREQQVMAAQKAWEKQAGKKHALYLHFIQFPHDDGSFPTWEKDAWKWVSTKELVDATTAGGATPIITLEPMVFEKFYQNWAPGRSAYDATEKYARAAGAWGKPLFIRFAHEMNGTWYPWSEWRDKNKNQQRDPDEDTGHTPERYRTAYRNVALLFRKYAPNVALIWCPNSGLLGGARRDPYRPWYPGDDVVDWVGLDFYERGWTLPMPGARLWGGQFAYNMTHDASDDGDTPQNESVNFYKTFAVGKNKPMILAETAATLSYRTDLTAEQRATMTHGWKSGKWNKSEYGWLQSVYGTTAYKDQPLLNPIDTKFPLLKAIVWFQIAKREWVTAQKTENGVESRVYFENVWTDYRIGGGSEEGGDTPHYDEETKLYRKLIAPGYFLSTLQR